MRKVLTKIKDALIQDPPQVNKITKNLLKPSITSEIKSMLEELSQNIEEVKQITAS